MEGLIVPIVKKGERRKVVDYRGKTLMPSMYKLYRMILEEVERGDGGERSYTTDSNRF